MTSTLNIGYGMTAKDDGHDDDDGDGDDDVDDDGDETHVYVAVGFKDRLRHRIGHHRSRISHRH